jgi:DNA-binding response OmpR family regulator
LVVLDVMLPKMNGLDLLQQVRQQGNRTPIIILSAKSELPDRLTAFEHGVDDYLPKPFFVEELIARIKALLSRQSSQSVDQLTYGPLRLEVLDHKAHWHDVTAVLSQKEFSLLSYLMRSPGHIYSRKQILKHVWNIDFDPETNVVDVCVRRIRRKLSRHSDANEDFIESVRGVGYRLNIEAAR